MGFQAAPWACRAHCVCVPVLPGVTFSEARLADLSSRGVAPMPRELAFPVPKGEKWHNLYDYIRYSHSPSHCSSRSSPRPGERQDG